MLVCVPGSGNELEGVGGSCVSLQTVFMLLLEPHVSVTFSTLFLSVFYILSPSVKFQMPWAPSVYWSFFFFLMHCNMSTDNLKECCPVIQWHSRSGNTRAVTQCWGQRLALAFLNLSLKHRSPNVLRADDPNSWQMCGFIQSLGVCGFVECVFLIHKWMSEIGGRFCFPLLALDDGDDPQHQLCLSLLSH